MKKLDVLSSFLGFVSCGICFALSMRHESAFLAGLGHFFWCAGPFIAVTLLLMLWFWKSVALRFVLASTFFVFVMTGNVKIAKELDMMAIMTAECNRFKEIEDIESLKEKKYPLAEYGEYGTALEYRKKELLFSRKVNLKLRAIMAVLDFDELFSPEVLFSQVRLLTLRKQYEESLAKLIAVERESNNCYTNLFRIFCKNKWKHSSLQNELMDLFQKETELRLQWCDDIFYNLKGQLYSSDDLIAFLLERHGFFTLDRDGLIHFDYDDDNERYCQICQDIDAWFTAEPKIHETFNSSMALL